MKHCRTCSCEAQDELDRRKREREREEREREFVARHSVMSGDELDWARNRVAEARVPS